MKEIFNTSEPYIIAETAYSFEGDSDYLNKQVEEISNSKIDCIKFHLMFNKESYAVSEYKILHEYLNKWILDKKVWLDLLTLSKNNNLDNLILTDDLESIEFCKKNNELVDGIEVHASCVNDLDILDSATDFTKEYDKSFFIGISGFEFQEISGIVEYLKNKKMQNVVLMYGFQNFPTKIGEINLSKIPLIQNSFGFKVGYADHTRFDDENKDNLVITSYALGANIQEIHYVLKEGMERIDYITALSSRRIIKIKDTLNNIKLSLGNIDFRLNDGEKKYLNSRKVPVYKNDIQKNKTLTEENICFKRVESSNKQFQFREIEKYFGKNLLKNVKSNDSIILGDFDD